MKVLHISNVSNISGWSKQAEMHLLSLDSAGVDVTARNINILNNENSDLHPRVKELLRKECNNPDIIIQNILPHMLKKTSRSKCVSYFVCETSNFRGTNWASRLNLMDLVLTPCYHNKLAAIDSGVTTKIDIVSECVDISKYSNSFPLHPLRQQHKDKFIFLCMAEWTVRKNIEAIVRSFHTEFSPSEPVELVIKTTPAGMSNPQNDINAKLESVKRGLKLYNNTDRYKRENVICGFLSEQDMGSLYKSCDAYVNASRAEAFSIPTMDALGFGVPVVSPVHSGLDYLNDKNCFVVSHYEQPCFNAMDTLPDIYNSSELWNEVSIYSLREQMRSVYEKKTLSIKKVQAGRETVKQYSLESVGKKYKQVLEKSL